MVLTLAINARISGDTILLLCFIEYLIGGLLTVYIDFLYSSLKTVTKPVDTKHSKATFEDTKKLRQ